MQKDELKGHASMLGANLMWGAMSPVAKLLMIGGTVSPLVVTDLRIGGAMVLFWLASFFLPAEHVAPKDMLKLFVASLLAIVFNQGSFIFGVGMTSPVDASIITTSMPLWAMLLAALYLKEPITGKKVLGIAAGASGALLLILGSGQNTVVHEGDNHILGDFLILAAQFSYACYIVFFKNFVTKYSLVTIMKWMFTYAFICALPFSYHSLSTTAWTTLNFQEIIGILFVVVCGTFLSYVFVVVGQKSLRPTVAGMYNYLQPVVATSIAILWGLDTFNVMKVISVLLIISGVYLVTTSKSRQDMQSIPEEK